MTENFTLEELTRSDYAIRKGLDNTPNPDVEANLLILAQGLERIRALIGRPLLISSGYRSPKVNAGVGGSDKSYHMKGLAADFTVPYMTPAQVCYEIESHKDQVLFDKIILEFGRWVHVQFPEPEEPPRLATYTIRSAKEGYIGGIHA
jgi:zinc D-Ala-D-Ala carboxypeptidase